MRRSIVLLALAMAAFVAGATGSVRATAPGRNGRIAFRRYFNDAQTRGAIFTINPDGTNERQLTHSHAGILTTEPDWSPNGPWIVFNVWPQADDNRSRIVKIRANGTDRTNLGPSCTAPCLTDVFPQWYGKRIVFQRGLGPSVGKNQGVRDLHDAGRRHACTPDHPTRGGPSRSAALRRSDPDVVTRRNSPRVRPLQAEHRPYGRLHDTSRRIRASTDHPLEA